MTTYLEPVQPKEAIATQWREDVTIPLLNTSITVMNTSLLSNMTVSASYTEYTEATKHITTHMED